MTPIENPRDLKPLQIEAIAFAANLELDRLDRMARKNRNSVGRAQAVKALVEFDAWHNAHWLRIREARRLEAFGGGPTEAGTWRLPE